MIKLNNVKSSFWDCLRYVSIRIEYIIARISRINEIVILIFRLFIKLISIVRMLEIKNSINF